MVAVVVNVVVKGLTGAVVVTGLGPGALNPNTWFELPPLMTRLLGDIKPLRGDLDGGCVFVKIGRIKS